jgi:hypothetical protein
MINAGLNRRHSHSGLQRWQTIGSPAPGSGEAVLLRW